VPGFESFPVTLTYLLGAGKLTALDPLGVEPLEEIPPAGITELNSSFPFAGLLKLMLQPLTANAASKIAHVMNR
jgi:hypothetical protein